MNKKTKLIMVILAISSLLGARTFLYSKLVRQPEEIFTENPNNTFLEVPFICQAPLQTEANWEYHEESCEEAAVLMAYLYDNNRSVSKQEAHEEILKMIDWQIENFGEHRDIYAEEVKEFIHGYYGLPLSKIVIVNNATIEDIERILAKGAPIIAPITGEILQNPNYPYPGYHMLLIKGITETTVITNDNGTRKGENFEYDHQVFMEAMNDAGGNIIYLQNHQPLTPTSK
ncbi:hypothetical protein HOF67_03855 [Candidatus Peregrinibacteria bacterium]|jgi:hypothetical protein|nr:hypothetical protein [Candidatus Peregrinibacteria bacterium]